MFVFVTVLLLFFVDRIEGKSVSRKMSMMMVMSSSSSSISSSSSNSGTSGKSI